MLSYWYVDDDHIEKTNSGHFKFLLFHLYILKKGSLIKSWMQTIDKVSAMQ